MLLTNYYTHSTSIPSRGAFLTGRYPIRTGLWDEAASKDAELPDSEITLAQELKSAGYSTYMVGKWNLGYSSKVKTPTQRGFDEFYGQYTDEVDYYLKQSASGYIDLTDGETVVSDDTALDKDMHLGFVYQKKAEDYIKEHANSEDAGSPFFLYYAMQMAHTPMQVPQAYLDRCEYPTSQFIDDTDLALDMQARCGMNVMIDEAISNLTCVLSSLPIVNNTLLIVTSANGGDEWLSGNNYPYKGSKGEWGRGGLSVNALVHGKVIPSISRGKSYTKQFHVTDWLPTLMHLASGDEWEAGYAGQELDGVDMWDALTKNDDTKHVDILHGFDADGSVSVQSDMLKYAVNPPTNYKTHKPEYTFDYDQDEYMANELCYMPSLMYSYEEFDPSSLVNLWDLEVDPNEGYNVTFDDAYTADLNNMLSRCESLKADAVVTVAPNSNKKSSAWSDCGGVCPWLDVEDSEVPVDQKYQYNDAPNIVFVLVDDWGINDAGYHSTFMNWTTPTIDKLASEGIKLNNYWTSKSCVPTRASLLTGRYTLRTGTWQDRASVELPLNEFTIAQEMKSAGYRTYMVGKWHMGFSTTLHTPNHRGFDSFYGYYNGFVDYYTKVYGDHIDLHDNMALATDEWELSEDVHNGFVLSRRAEMAIKEHVESYPNQPMFFYYAMQLVHGEWAVDERFSERCRYQETDATNPTAYELEVTYCGMNLMLDEAMANLTCALNENGMDKNTIMIIASDNGAEKSLIGSNEPFRGTKGSNFRGGVSVNGFIHSQLVPEARRGGSYDGAVHVTDWLPTLMGLATGKEWDGSYVGAKIDGRDVWDAIMNDDESPTTEMAHHVDPDGLCSLSMESLKLDVGQVVNIFETPNYYFPANDDSFYKECDAASLLVDEGSNETAFGFNWEGVQGYVDGARTTFSIHAQLIGYVGLTLAVLVGTVLAVMCAVVHPILKRKYAQSQYRSVKEVGNAEKYQQAIDDINTIAELDESRSLLSGTDSAI
jgi:arylsulfatase A-like enzyme